MRGGIAGYTAGAVEASAVLERDHAGVLAASAAVLAAVHVDGIDEPSYQAAVAQVRARGYLVPVLVVWAQALAHAHLGTDRPLHAISDTTTSRSFRPSGAGISGGIGAAVARRARRRVLRYGNHVLLTARALLRTHRGVGALIVEVDRISRRLGPQIDDLVRLFAIATRPVPDLLGAPRGLDQFYKVMAIVQNTAGQHARASACSTVISMLAAVAAGHPDHAARHLDAFRRPHQLLDALVPVAQLVMSGRTIGVAVDPDGAPAAIVDPATAGDPSFARTHQLVDAITSRDQHRLDAAVAAVTAAGDHDLGMVVWYLTQSVGAKLGQIFATHAARTAS